MYVKVVNGVAETYTIGQLRKDNPNTSFPRSIPVETLASYNVFPAFDVPKPAVTNLQRVQQNGYALDGLGNWTPVYEVVDMFSDYVDENGQTVTKAEQEAAHISKIREAKKSEFEAAVQNLLDTEARSKGYDNMLSLVSYNASTKPQWKAEATAAIKWRDDCWNEALVQLGNYIATGVEPTMEDFLAAMPAINWPQA